MKKQSGTTLLPRIRSGVQPQPPYLVVILPISAWCARVALTLEDTKTIVFNKGTLNGLKRLIPASGHIDPASMFGLKLAGQISPKEPCEETHLGCGKQYCDTTLN